MRYLVGLFLVFILFSCNGVSSTKAPEEILMDGNWTFTSSELPYKQLRSGLKFSHDNQVFMLDSQGQVISPSHERIYKVKGDTLTFVDFKYLEQVRYEKGTDIFIIEELTDEKMVLNIIHPQPENRLIFHRQK